MSLLKTAVIEVGKRVPFVLDAARATLAAVRRARFELLRATRRVDPRVTVFECYSGRAFACSPRALYEAMRADERYSGHELVWAFKEPLASQLKESMRAVREGGSHSEPLRARFGDDALESLGGATIVAYRSRAYYEAYARAGTWITNSIVPTHLRPGTGQTYVQCWHGTPLKRLGCDIDDAMGNAMYSVRAIHRRYRAEGKRFDRILSPSAFASEHLASAFDLVRTGRAGAVLELGYPRNDALASVSSERIAAVKARLGVLEERKVVLYAPTWRDDQHASGSGYTYRAEVDFERIRDEFGDEVVILFRAHYLVANAFDFTSYAGFVFDVSAVNDINDLYLVSDVLVTDYSSVFFDYAVLGRPLVFYMYDLEAYRDELRGFYLDIAELPGPIARTQDELAEALSAALNGVTDPRLEAFRRRFAPLDDGHASERVLAALFPAGNVEVVA